MTYFASALTGVALLCAASASANTSGEMPNQYFDGMCRASTSLSCADNQDGRF